MRPQPAAQSDDAQNNCSSGTHPSHWNTDKTQIALASAMIVAVSYGWGRYNYGLFLPEIKNAFSLTPYWLGLIGSLSYSGYILATLITSLLASQLGPRLLITLGGACASIGLLLVAQAQSPLMLLFGLVIAGMSPGLCYTPLSDVVVHTYPKSQQGRAYAFINTGTGFGVIMVGPLALWLGAQWREVWVILSFLAVLITLWIWCLMPSKPNQLKSEVSQGLPSLNWLFNLKRLKLYLFAFTIGLASSVYWTFSVDIISEASGEAEILGMSGQFGTRLFWIVLGATGCFGMIAGDVVRRVGLTAAIKLFSIMISASMLLLSLGASNTSLTLTSAAMFGGSFVILTAFVGIWSVHSFYQRPSAGFGLAFLIMSLGQFVGPFVAGIIAEEYGLQETFVFGTLLSVCLFFFKPSAKIQSLTPDES